MPVNEWMKASGALKEEGAMRNEKATNPPVHKGESDFDPTVPVKLRHVQL